MALKPKETTMVDYNGLTAAVWARARDKKRQVADTASRRLREIKQQIDDEVREANQLIDDEAHAEIAAISAAAKQVAIDAKQAQKVAKQAEKDARQAAKKAEAARIAHAKNPYNDDRLYCDFVRVGPHKHTMRVGIDRLEDGRLCTLEDGEYGGRMRRPVN